MRTMRNYYILVLLLLTVSPLPVNGESNNSDITEKGFRKLTWGMELSDVSKIYPDLKKRNKYNVYEREKEERLFLGTRSELIVYDFQYNELKNGNYLGNVSIYFDMRFSDPLSGIFKCDFINNDLLNNFGKPRIIKEDGFINKYEWDYGDTHIALSFRTCDVTLSKYVPKKNIVVKKKKGGTVRNTESAEKAKRWKEFTDEIKKDLDEQEKEERAEVRKETVVAAKLADSIVGTWDCEIRTKSNSRRVEDGGVRQFGKNGIMVSTYPQPMKTNYTFNGKILSIGMGTMKVTKLTNDVLEYEPMSISVGLYTYCTKR